MTATLNAYLHALAKGEWAQVCQYLDRGTHHLLQGMVAHSTGKLSGCGAAVKVLITSSTAERADPFISRGLAAVRVKYPTAFALFYGTNGAKYVMPMQIEGGKWKVTQMAPLPYPLGTPEQPVP